MHFQLEFVAYAAKNFLEHHFAFTANLYVNTIFDMIRTINEEGTTVLLVEQNAKKALSIADRAYVLEIGKIAKTGTGAELLSDDSIRRAYLGD